MLARLGDRLTAFFRATAPDPFVLAILLTLLTFFLAWGLTDSAPWALVESWQSGLWQPSLLAFAFQMCLILVTGHALAASPAMARAIGAVAAIPRTARGAVAMTAAVSIIAGLVNWGLGLIVGSILARDVGRAMRARHVPVCYPLLAAAGYTSLLCWHGGLSGTAPLLVAKSEHIQAIADPATAAAIGALPVTRTLLTPLNFIVTGGMLVLVPLALTLLCRKEGAGEEPAWPHAIPAAPPPPARAPPPGTVPEWLDRSPLVVWLLAAPAIVWLAAHFAKHGAAGLTLDTAIMAFYAAGIVLHGSAARYMDAATEAAAGCSGIVVQFPLYFGIMAMMNSSGLALQMARWFTEASGGSEGWLAVMTFWCACILGLFIPSGGGQWAVQGPIALKAAADAGIDPGKLVMAVAFGDEWANMLQPFWALPLLAITGVKAREIIAFTAIAALVAGVWMTVWLAVL